MTSSRGKLFVENMSFISSTSKRYKTIFISIFNLFKGVPAEKIPKVVKFSQQESIYSIVKRKQINEEEAHINIFEFTAAYNQGKMGNLAEQEIRKVRLPEIESQENLLAAWKA